MHKTFSLFSSFSPSLPDALYSFCDRTAVRIQILKASDQGSFPCVLHAKNTPTGLVEGGQLSEEQATDYIKEASTKPL